jgi:hypothetical protein
VTLRLERRLSRLAVLMMEAARSLSASPPLRQRLHRAPPGVSASVRGGNTHAWMQAYLPSRMGHSITGIVGNRT